MSIAPGSIAAIILAGGLGTRIQHLLPGVPKPMAPVAGRPFLEWQARYLAHQGIRRAVISTGYLAEVVERHFQRQPVNGVVIKCVAEREPLGTAGAVLHTVRTSGEQSPAWLVCNGDTLFLAELGDLFRVLDDPTVAGAIVGREVPDSSRYGSLVCGPAGELLGFAEKQPGKGMINAGIYLLRDSLLKEFPEQSPLSLETEVFPLLLARRARLKVHWSNAPFLDIGTPETLLGAGSFIQQNQPHFC